MVDKMQQAVTLQIILQYLESERETFRNHHPTEFGDVVGKRLVSQFLDQRVLEVEDAIRALNQEGI